VLFRNLTIMSLAGDERGRDLLERLIERLVVEKNPVIIVIPVEPVFDLPDGPCNLPDVRVSGQSYKSGIDTFAGRRR